MLILEALWLCYYDLPERWAGYEIDLGIGKEVTVH